MIAQPCAASAYSCSSVLSVPAASVSYAPKPTQGSSNGSTRVPTRGSDSVFIIRSACAGGALLLQVLQHGRHSSEALYRRTASWPQLPIVTAGWRSKSLD